MRWCGTKPAHEEKLAAMERGVNATRSRVDQKQARLDVKHHLTCPFGPSVRVRHDRVCRQLQLLVLEIPGAEVESIDAS